MIASTCRRLISLSKCYPAGTITGLMDLGCISSSHLIRNYPIHMRLYSETEAPAGIEPGEQKQKTKTPEVPKITLLDVNNNITVTTLIAAEKLSSSKKLRLIRVVDTTMKTKRQVYKLMTEAQYLEEEIKEKHRAQEEKKNKKTSAIKGGKLMTLSSRISNHDLELKLSKVLKWIEKKFEVRVVISGSAENTTPQEELYKKLENATKGISRIVQKRMNGGDLKFQILPPKEVKEKASKPSTGPEKTAESSECL